MKWALPATSLHMSFFLHQGKIEEEGHPDALFGAPKSPRLQQFLKGSLK